MFKRFLIAVAFLMAGSPAFVSAQDFFFSFDEFSRQSSISIDPATTSTGQVFIFADVNFFEFEQLDLDFSNDNPSAVAFTGATTFNNDDRFSTLITEGPIGSTPITATDGRLFGASFFSPGLPLPDGPLVDFRPGANGFLLAQVDFDVVGSGTANFDFSLGAIGIIDDGFGPLEPDFSGSTGTVFVGVPEPSSAVLFVLGAVGMVARRRRRS